MAEEIQTPAAPVAPAQAPATPTQVAPATATPPEEKDPEVQAAWLKGRLEQAKRAGAAELLKELGVEKPDDAKAALARVKEIETAALTESERVAKQIADLTPKASRAESLEATVKQYAERELAGLTEAQRIAVAAVAGDDPSRVLSAVEALRPTWAATPVTQAPVVTPARNTSTPATPPAPVTPGSPPDHKAVYTRLDESNPIAAARYAQRHPSVLSE